MDLSTSCYHFSSCSACEDATGEHSLAASSHLDSRGDGGLRLGDPLAPIPHVRIIVDKLPAGFDEADGRGPVKGHGA